MLANLTCGGQMKRLHVSSQLDGELHLLQQGRVDV